MNAEFEKIIDLNEKFSHAIFWLPPAGASARRSYEKKNSLENTEKINGVEFYADCVVDCSCKHVYHYQHYKINGISCNKMKFKNMLEKISEGGKLAKKDRERFEIVYNNQA